MSEESGGRRSAGFKDRTRVAAARERLREAVTPHERVERVALGEADGRALAEAVSADRNVPHYRRAAMDGWAVRAEDTFGAGDRSPAVLERVERAAESAGELPPGGATRVHTGSPVPAGADAVVMVEHAETVGRDVEVFDAVAAGENVGVVGEDVAAGDDLFDAGHRLRPSDLGLLKAVGVREVPVYERPTVAVVPTGEEVVEADPAPGEVVETNGLTVARLTERWGADARRHGVVTDDRDDLRDAIEGNLDADLVVTTGGSSVGERDLVPDVVADCGDVLVHGVALKPGHPAALGRVEDTPVVMLPGYPVAAIVNAVQFLRPAVKWTANLPVLDLPTATARLGRKIRSEPGIRTFARVALEADDDTGDRTAHPVRVSGSGILSSVALSDGWVVVPEESEGIAEGETVDVELWEELP
jgi:molybdopterin molybdotransferase